MTKKVSNPVSNLTILFVIIVISVFAFLLYTESPAGPVQSETISSVQGHILNAQTLEPITGINIRIGTQQNMSDNTGYFKFDNIDSQVIAVSGQEYFQNIEVPITTESNIKILLDSKLFNFLRDFKDAEEFRQYRKIYSTLSNNSQSQISLEKFLAEKNKWRDALADTGEYIGMKVITNNFLVDNPSRDNAISLNIEYIWEYTENTDQYIIQQDLIFENDMWKFANYKKLL